MKNFQVNLFQQPAKRLLAASILHISAAQLKAFVMDLVRGALLRLPSLVYWCAIVILILSAVVGILVGAFIFASLINKFDFTLASSLRIYALICLFGFGLLHKLIAAQNKTAFPLHGFILGVEQKLGDRFQKLLRNLTAVFVRVAQPAIIPPIVPSITISSQYSENTEKAVLNSFWIISDYSPDQEVTAEENL